MFRIWILLWTLVFSCSVRAETIPVNADEQGDLTRVAIAFQTRPAWVATRMGQRHQLRFSAPSMSGFDLSGAFQSMNRERVSDIRVLSANELEFDLSCDCSLAVTNGSGGTVIVEIADRIENGNLSNLNAGSVQVPEHDLGMPEPPSQVSRNLPRTTSDNLTEPSIDQSFSVTEPSTSELPIVLGELGILPQIADQSVAVELIGRAFSRAALQGLVAANTQVGSRSDEFSGKSGLPKQKHANLSVSTVFDPVEVPKDRSIPPTALGAVCFSDRDADVPAWGDAEDRRHLGVLRTQSVAEDGTISPAGAIKLARHYLWMGFGAEAMDTISFYPKSRSRSLVEAIAEILDHGETSSDILNGQLHCEGRISLWGALSRSFSSREAPDTANHILSAFNALPPHLRSHLGPKLSERLRAGGLEGAAQTALNAVTRGGKITDESSLATARLDLGGSQAEDARDVLADLSNGTDLTAASALLELLRDAEARNMPPNPEWVNDAPTLVDAVEGTPEAEHLNIAGLRGLVALERFDDFRAAIVVDGPGLTTKVRHRLAIHALEKAVIDGTDDAFLRAEIGISTMVANREIPQALKQKLAERLVDLGVPGRALQYLEDAPSSSQLLGIKVKALGALGRQTDALTLATETATDGQDRILADALYAAGEFRQAVDVFQSIGQDESAESAALRIGDWAWLERNGTESLSETLTRLRIELPPPAPDMPNGSLVQNSRDLRESVEMFLDATRSENLPAAFTN